MAETLCRYYWHCVMEFLKTNIGAAGSNQRVVANMLSIYNINLVSQYRVYDVVERFFCSMKKEIYIHNYDKVHAAFLSSTILSSFLTIQSCNQSCGLVLSTNKSTGMIAFLPNISSNEVKREDSCLAMCKHRGRCQYSPPSYPSSHLWTSQACSGWFD